MKVTCIHNTGDSYSGYRMPHGFFITSQFNLSIGAEYLVMGVLYSECAIFYLLDNGGKPSFFPFQLFDIIDPELKAEWYCRVYSNSDENYLYRQAIFGYYELCYDDEHYENLVENDQDALNIYFRRKKMASEP